MSHLLSNVEPKIVWDYFYQLTQIPRPSKKEKSVCEYLLALAKKMGLEAAMDNAMGSGWGNVVIKVPATKGYEKAPILIIQSHVDIVGLPPERHDRPLDLVLDQNWLRAKGSTLGADNGIGVAIQLALMSDTTLVHGPLELLFTVDEETGMTGANNLEPGLLKGSMLLNFDSEEEGALCVGCAGGNRTRIKLPLTFVEPPEHHVAVKVIIADLKGGHSGTEIDKGRACAGKLLTRLLNQENKVLDVKITSINWGSVDNAIPNEAEAIILVQEGDEEVLQTMATKWTNEFRLEFGKKEPNLVVKIEKSADRPTRVMRDDCAYKVINLLQCLPQGVAMMSHDIPGLVETSSNIGVVKTIDNEIRISVSQRSSVAPALDGIIAECEACAKLAGAKYENGSRYYGWHPNMDSKLLNLTEQTYTEMFGTKPKVGAIHAGLEPGLISAKYPHLDMLSIGPTLLDAHVPSKADYQMGADIHSKGERIDVSRLPDFWKFTCKILENVAKISD